MGRYYENPSDQRNYELNNEKQSKPRPIPLIKSVFDFHTPKNFGPKIAGQNMFGDWHMNLISRWSADLGLHITLIMCLGSSIMFVTKIIIMLI